jgi:primosomal protein N'
VGFYEQELEFRQQLRYPPTARVALLTLKGRNEQKVQFAAEHLRRELDKRVGSGGTPESGKAEKRADEPGELLPLDEPPVVPAPAGDVPGRFRDLIIAGPAPAPLLRAETFYRYQIMLRTGAMSRLSRALAQLSASFVLPDDVTLTVDIDPTQFS